MHNDLRNFAIALCKDHLAPMFMHTGNKPGDESDSDDYWPTVHRSKISKFCYALATNGLSFALGIDDHEENCFEPATDTWPRTTQLIMLNEKADLGGGLMDFDISVASCAYDGLTVYVTPRAAFSLKTLIQVTPFVYEERRNRRRITKVK